MTTFAPGIRPYLLHKLRNLGLRSAASLLHRDAKGLLDLEELPRERGVVQAALAWLGVVGVAAPYRPLHWDDTAPGPHERAQPLPVGDYVANPLKARTVRRSRDAIGGTFVDLKGDNGAPITMHFPHGVDLRPLPLDEAGRMSWRMVPKGPETVSPLDLAIRSRLFTDLHTDLPEGF